MYKSKKTIGLCKDIIEKPWIKRVFINCLIKKGAWQFLL